MALHAHHSDPAQQQMLCGQAEEISDILSRTGSLPAPLHLTIEELLENAWEIAYQRSANANGSNVIEFASFKGRTAVSG